MTTRKSPGRIPEGRLDKARFYVAQAQRERATGRLQSAETFLRLAAVMDPSSAGISALLSEVVKERAC